MGKGRDSQQKAGSGKTFEPLVPGKNPLRTIADTAVDSMFLKDAQRRYTFVNRAMTQLFGCKEEDLLGKTPEELFDPESARVITEVDACSLAGEEVTEERELVIGGETKWFHTIQVPVRDTGGGIVGVCGIVRDITERMMARDALVASEEALREANERLAQQKEELERKNITLREIVASIETEKMAVAKQVSANVDKVLMPALARLKKRMNSSLKDDLERVERTVADLTSQFGVKMTAADVQMSPREIEVSDMIRNGMTSKQISDALGISVRTVEVHRAKIRKKLGLQNESVNLAAYLQHLP